MGEAAKHRSFCCAHVAVSMGEAAKPQSLLVFWRLRVYGGSCRTSVSSRVSASPLASPCLWGKLQNIVRSAALTSPCRGSCKTSVSACLLASHEPFHYLILDRYGQIDSCSHDIVDVRPTGCLVNACDLPFYLFHPFSDPSCQRASPALSAQSRKATLLASIFQHLSTACLLFFAFFYEKGRIRFKMKKINLARGWEDTPPGLDRAAKFADMACELSWDPIGCATVVSNCNESDCSSAQNGIAAHHLPCLCGSNECWHVRIVFVPSYANNGCTLNNPMLLAIENSECNMFLGCNLFPNVSETQLANSIHVLIFLDYEIHPNLKTQIQPTCKVAVRPRLDNKDWKSSSVQDWQHLKKFKARGSEKIDWGSSQFVGCQTWALEPCRILRLHPSAVCL